MPSDAFREIAIPRREGVDSGFTKGTAPGDVITECNSAALNAIRAGRTPPPVASRALAILHASIYDAVNGIDRTHEAYFVQSAVPASASKEAAAMGNTMEQNALLNLAMADAAICAWDTKYTYDFWRPVNAIRNGQTDGNDATIADPTWSSFIVTPPFRDYVSGHSTFSGAASTVLARFYGTDGISFTTGSDFLPGVTRTFTSFSAAASEAAVSRLYGGIHYRSANEDGLAAGIEIGEWTFAHYMQPKGNRARK